MGQILSARRALARTAALVFGFCPICGSLGYHAWGGAPNMLAMTFFLAITTTISACRLGLVTACIVGALFAALSIVHNHVMISTGVVLVGLTAFWIFRKRHRSQAPWLVVAGLAALLLGSRHYFALLSRTSSLGKTDILKFKEPLFTTWVLVESLGYLFILILAIGLGRVTVLAMRKQANAFQIRRWQGLHVTVIALITCFVAGGYLYRWYARVQHGQDWVAFTPSRFLTNAIPFLCVYAAQVPLWLTARFGKETPMYAMLILAGIGGNWFAWKGALQIPDMPKDELSAMQYIERNTPEHAIVLTENQWAPYLCNRRTMRTPLPITELYRGKPESHAQVVRGLKDPKSMEATQLFLVVIGAPEAIRLPGEVLWRGPSGLAVLRIIVTPTGR